MTTNAPPGVLDSETTGLNPRTDRIVTIGKSRMQKDCMGMSQSRQVHQILTELSF